MKNKNGYRFEILSEEFTFLLSKSESRLIDLLVLLNLSMIVDCSTDDYNEHSRICKSPYSVESEAHITHSSTYNLPFPTRDRNSKS